MVVGHFHPTAGNIGTKMNDRKKFHEGEKNKYYVTAKICVKVLRKQRDDMSLMKGFR